MTLRKRRVSFKDTSGEDGDTQATTSHQENSSLHGSDTGEDYKDSDNGNGKYSSKPERKTASPINNSFMTQSSLGVGSLLPTQIIASFLSQIDDVLKSYGQFASRTSHHDKILKVIQYSLWFISKLYGPSSVHNEFLIKLNGEICWTRYVNRFLEWPAAVEGVRSGSWASSKTLGRAMAWTMIFYYPLEYYAYARWKLPHWNGLRLSNPTNLDGKNLRWAERASAWSCRFWLAYIILDIYRSTSALHEYVHRREKQERQQHQAQIEGGEDGIVDSNKSTVARTETLQLLRNGLFLLPALHWSLPNWDTSPWLPSDLVNLLMWIESLVCMHQAA